MRNFFVILSTFPQTWRFGPHFWTVSYIGKLKLILVLVSSAIQDRVMYGKPGKVYAWEQVISRNSVEILVIMTLRINTFRKTQKKAYFHHSTYHMLSHKCPLAQSFYSNIFSEIVVWYALPCAFEILPLHLWARYHIIMPFLVKPFLKFWVVLFVDRQTDRRYWRHNLFLLQLTEVIDVVYIWYHLWIMLIIYMIFENHHPYYSFALLNCTKHQMLRCFVYVSPMERFDHHLATNIKMADFCAVHLFAYIYNMSQLSSFNLFACIYNRSQLSSFVCLHIQQVSAEFICLPTYITGPRWVHLFAYIHNRSQLSSFVCLHI